jgi:hypothetical protein
VTEERLPGLLEAWPGSACRPRASRSMPRLGAALAPHAGAADPDVPLDPLAPYLLIFTSGTTGQPKAALCSQQRLAFIGWNICTNRGVKPGDVCYQAMPLFHSNQLMAGWVPALYAGATLAMRRRFSASGFLRRAQIRRHLLQLRRQAAHLRARHARAAGRRRQHAAARLRKRSRRPRSRALRQTIRLPGDRRLRLDRGRGLDRARAGHAAGLARHGRPGHADPRPRDRAREAGRALRRGRQAAERRRGYRRDRERAERGHLRGVLQERRGERGARPQQDLLDGRPRLSRRAGLPLLRGP